VYRKQPTARLLVNYDVILVTSQYSKSSHSETRNRINYPWGPFNHTLSQDQLIWLRTLGEEVFGITLPQVKIANNQYC